MTLNPEQARRFYDRLGGGLDSQGFYEEVALEALAAKAGFECSTAVFELGCGTGKFAAHLLRHRLPVDASYLAVDISSTMVRLARDKLAAFGPRARVDAIEAGAPLPLADGAVDRVVATYVLDLLPEAEMQRVLAESHRILAPGGRLGLVSLTHPVVPLSRVVIALWSLVFRLNPTLVGGCRPVALEPLLNPALWSVEHREVVTAFGVPSEVLVAVKR